MRILVTSVPNHSHLVPALPFLEAARAAGHAVTVATGANALAMLEEAGVPTVVAGPTSDEIGAHTREHVYSQPRTPAGSSVDTFMNYAATELVRDLLPVARSLRPDLVVTTIAEFGGQVVARALDVPLARHGFSPPKMIAPNVEVLATFNDLCVRSGAPAYDGEMRDPYLGIWPTALCPDAADLHGEMYPERWPLRP